MKYAVCAVIIKDGLILATHRRDNKNDWGLPGGKVDTNEFLRDAIIRETLEETGMTTNFILYCMKLDGEYNVACFIGNGDQLKVVTTVHEGLGKMVPIKNVTEGCFGKFNKELFDDMVAKGYNIPL